MKNKVKECLAKIGIYLLLVVGIGLLLSPMLESTIVETVSNRYLLQNYTAAQIAGNTAQARFEGSVIEEDIVMLELSSILSCISDIDKEQVIGAIVIPSVGLYQPIFNGTTQANLIAGAGTMKEDQVMGKGNYCLAGHHMKDESLLFGPLSKVEIGDWIQLTDKAQLYTYEVTEVAVIHENEVEVLEDSKTPAVTLITCDQAGISTNYRLMVKGTLIDISVTEEGKTYEGKTYEGEKTYEKESGQEQEETMNKYQEVFHYLTTNSKTTGIYRLWMWIIVVGVLAAALFWTGTKILRINDTSDESEGSE